MKTISKVSIPKEITEYLRSSSVAYLSTVKEAIPFILTKDVEGGWVVSHDSDLVCL